MPFLAGQSLPSDSCEETNGKDRIYHHTPMFLAFSIDQHLGETVLGIYACFGDRHTMRASEMHSHKLNTNAAELSSDHSSEQLLVGPKNGDIRHTIHNVSHNILAARIPLSDTITKDDVLRRFDAAHFTAIDYKKADGSHGHIEGQELQAAKASLAEAIENYFNALPCASILELQRVPLKKADDYARVRKMTAAIKPLIPAAAHKSVSYAHA